MEHDVEKFRQVPIAWSQKASARVSASFEAHAEAFQGHRGKHMVNGVNRRIGTGLSGGLYMTEELRISTTIHAKPQEIYRAWLNSEKHSAMTGSEARIEPSLNGTFTAWDGYIEGTTIEMESNHRIVQKWRTTDFPLNSPDSRLEILLKEVEKGTRITLIHSEIPAGQADDYKKGWKEFYFDPMRIYFKKKSG